MKQFEPGDKVRTVTGEIETVIQQRGNVVQTDRGYRHVTKVFPLKGQDTAKESE